VTLLAPNEKYHLARLAAAQQQHGGLYDLLLLLIYLFFNDFYQTYVYYLSIFRTDF